MQKIQLIALAMLLGSLPFRSIVVQQRKRSGIEPDERPIDLALVFTGILDVIKVFLPVYIAARFLDSTYLMGLVGLIGFLSSCFPYWLMFKPQGKGLGALLGILLGMNPVAGACAVVIWLVALFVLDWLSAAAIMTGICTPFLLKIFHAPVEYIIFSVAGCIYIIIAHSSSIPRLIDGSEPRWYRKNS